MYVPLDQAKKNCVNKKRYIKTPKKKTKLRIKIIYEVYTQIQKGNESYIQPERRAYKRVLSQRN